jgi:hypothetical protein
MNNEDKKIQNNKINGKKAKEEVPKMKKTGNE